MQEKFYISHQGKESGPHLVSEIVSKIRSGEITLEDYAFVESKEDWIPLFNVPEIEREIPKEKPQNKPKLSSVFNHDSHTTAKAEHPQEGGSSDVRAPHETAPSKEGVKSEEWFILKGENRFGPFIYFDLVRMLQEKALWEYDYVWHSGLSSWTRIAELNEFRVEQIRKIRDSGSREAAEIFFRRRHARVKYGGSIIVHDNQRIWKGESLEIGEGGAGIIMANSMITPGQTIYLHFKPGQGAPPFNAICEVVSKQYTKETKNAKTPLRYGLRFLNVNPHGKEFISSYVKEKKAA